MKHYLSTKIDNDQRFTPILITIKKLSVAILKTQKSQILNCHTFEKLQMLLIQSPAKVKFKTLIQELEDNGIILEKKGIIHFIGYIIKYYSPYKISRITTLD